MKAQGQTVLYIVIVLMLTPGAVWAQACCSAGVPLLGSLELPAVPVGNWQFALTYEMNALSDVVSGSVELDDDLRQRTVHLLMLEISRGLTRRWSVTALFSIIRQNRSIQSPFSPMASTLNTQGLGDGVILLKYSLLPLNMATQRELSLGVGPKLPLGRHDVRSASGILLPADMQPGSGAWDAVAWAYFYQGFLPTTRLNLFGSVSTRITGVNDLQYKFGNEVVATTSTGWRTDGLFDWSLSLRWRFTAPDKRFDEEISNTGGQWLMLIPGVNLKMAKSWTLRLAARLPVYRRLNGTQLTTGYRLAVSLFYVITRPQIAFDL